MLKKSALFALLLVALFCVQAHAGGVLSSNYSTLGDAVTAAQAASNPLILDSTVLLTGNLAITVPIVVIPFQGSVKQTGAYTLTIKGPCSVSSYPWLIGFGAGQVTFDLPMEVYGDWWATNTTPGTTDMAPAFRCAAASIRNGGIVKGQLNSTYLFNSKVTDTGESTYLHVPQNNVTFDGNGSTFITGGLGAEFWWNRHSYGVDSRVTFYLINDARRGNTSITLKTAGNASHFSVGDIVRISPYAISGACYGRACIDAAHDASNRITAIRSGTLYLQYPLGKDCLSSFTTNRGTKSGAPCVANVNASTTFNQTLKNMKVRLGAGDTFNIWQALCGGTWDNLDVEQTSSTSGSIQFWNEVFESRVSNSKFVTINTTSNGIGPGHFGSGHSYITNNKIIQYNTNSTVTAAAAGEGAEDSHFIGNTIISSNAITYTVAVDLTGSCDSIVQGNTIWSASSSNPVYSLGTNNGAPGGFGAINAVITGNSFINGIIKLGGLNDVLSQNNFYKSVIDVDTTTPASIMSNYFYSNDKPFLIILLENLAGALSSTISGNTIVNSGTAGTFGIYVSDPGSPQPYPLTIVGNNIQGFTNKIGWAGSANANLPNKLVVGNPGIPNQQNLIPLMH